MALLIYYFYLFLLVFNNILLQKFTRYDLTKMDFSRKQMISQFYRESKLIHKIIINTDKQWMKEKKDRKN